MFTKGYTPWNKGKTVNTDPRISKLRYWFGKKNPACSAKKKGKPSWNKGIPCSRETKDKLSRVNMGKPSPFKGRKHTAEAKRKIGLAGMGRPAWNKGTKGVMRPNSGTIKKGQFAGEKHHNWKGGVSRLPYAYTFTDKLKSQVKERDSWTCLLCRRTNDLTVHHINYNKIDCGPENLVTLCRSCNSKVNFKRSFWKDKIKVLLLTKKNGVKSGELQNGQP